MNSIVVNGNHITPSKIVCIGRNYAEHIAELGNEIPADMVVFNKPNSAISNQLLSYHQEPLHFEGELCFVVENGQFSAVGFGLDLTKRELQNQLKTKGLPWERAKAFDGSAVFSEFVAIDPNDINNQLTLQLSINDVVVQKGGIELMMYKPLEILAELSKYTSLCDGDVVMTGTPKGVGLIDKGASFKGQVLKNNRELIVGCWIAN